MLERRVARPRPAAAVAAARAALAAKVDPMVTIASLCERRVALAVELGLLDAQIEEIIATICGEVDDSIDVELYHGSFEGVTEKFVDQHERPIGMLHCAIDGGFGTGALIGDNLFLTAEHNFTHSCSALPFAQRFGWEMSRDAMSATISVVFNFQKDPAGRPQSSESFPILDFAERKLKGVDYAILVLGPNERGLPGKIYGTLTPASQDLTTKDSLLCIIQHPDGQQKRVHSGPLLNNDGVEISYSTIDTKDGSSGAPILDVASGHIVGVHTGGSCNGRGVNFGVAIGAIRAVSPILSQL